MIAASRKASPTASLPSFTEFIPSFATGFFNSMPMLAHYHTHNFEGIPRKTVCDSGNNNGNNKCSIMELCLSAEP